MNRYMSFSLMLAFVLIGTIVFGMTRMFRANTRWFIKNNVKLVGRIISAHEVEYRVVIMGTSANPFYSNPPPVCLVINGVTSSCDAITLQALLAIEDLNTRDTMDRAWPAGTKVYSLQGHSFWVSDGRILQIELWSHIDYNTRQEINPLIGSADCASFAPMPLSDDEVRRIFGSPDEIKDFFAK